MVAWYNEIEPFAADWIERLVERGHVAPGAVERRRIEDLRPADVAGSGQRHFFAGIGGWSYALRLAGVSDDADIWTGSCPCQPFSVAGARGGVCDPRHLWPAWFSLIAECRPPIVFGEQVASRDGLAWLDVVRSDVERLGYAFGASDLCAASVGAPHARQRLYFVAYAQEERRGSWRLGHAHGRTAFEPERHRAARELGDTDGSRAGWNPGATSRAEATIEGAGIDGGGLDLESLATGAARRMADADISGFWRDADWIPCSDRKSRPVEPGTFPLAHGVPGRVGRLRGYGNAIVPQVAAAFVLAALEAITSLR